MTVRNLDFLLTPASVAVIGASARPSSVGATVWRNLIGGSFAGPVFAVNPKYRELDGQPVFAAVEDLPQTPELAVICTPPATVPGLIDALARRGTRAAVVVSAGMTPQLKKAALDAARPHLLRILGPNCVGLLSPHIGLNASFAHIGARPGELAFVSQSGALVTAMLDWADAQQLGFSHFVSLGEHADVDFGDLLDYLAGDPHTRAILLYIESITEPRKFLSAARAAARNKPVIVVKAGRTEAGQRAAASHTGALAGVDVVYDAAIARAGMLRVDSLQELFLAAQTLTRLRRPAPEALTIVTNGGGAGVMGADAAAQQGVTLATLGAQTMRELDEVLPPTWSHGNPVDLIGDAPVARYVAAVQALARDPAAGALLFIHAPTAIVPSAEIARALVPVMRPASGRRLPVLSCWLGGQAVAEARGIFTEAGIPSYDTPEEAVRALAMLQAYARNQLELMETPPAAPDCEAPVCPDVDAVRRLVQRVLASGEDMLTEPQAKAVCEAYRIPVAVTRCVAAQPEAAAREAERIGFPVVLKILSPDISHKSDVGGVALNLDSAQAVHEAARTMLVRVRSLRPDAAIDGFSVQAMVRRAHAQELIVGATIDPVFGPVILFGQGGTAVELMADRAIALPPVNIPLARALVSRTRVARLLHGWRDTPAADVDALYGVIQTVSQLLVDIPEIAEIDLNPLVVNHEGVIALDARIRLSADAPAGAAHFAIQPYPAELAETVAWQGRTIELRPIRPEDEVQHAEFDANLDPEDLRLRYFYSRRALQHIDLARLTQIDYAREMAFIATAPGPDGRPQTLGVARAITDPDNISAEFGIIVRSDLKGGGLGRVLMDKLIRYLRAKGTRQLEATVLRENHRMLELALALGFHEIKRPAAEGGERTVVLDLQAAAPPA